LIKFLIIHIVMEYQ